LEPGGAKEAGKSRYQDCIDNKDYLTNIHPLPQSAVGDLQDGTVLT